MIKINDNLTLSLMEFYQAIKDKFSFVDFLRSNLSAKLITRKEVENLVKILDLIETKQLGSMTVDEENNEFRLYFYDEDELFILE